ncbi:MAG: ABC transporter substrate-binding protein [Chloroflexota bacterium]|nr:ABC transporter substrate-binding protein [Anaerolineales bacterium]
MVDKVSRRVVWLVLVMVTAVLLAACGGGGSDEAIKIGAIHDLTGATSDVGTPYADGIRDYVKFVNGNGGIDGRQIELMSADYAYAVDQAEQLYSQYTGQGVIVFQGWGTGDTEALRTKVAADEIPFMSASYSAALASPADAPYNFLIGTTYSDQFIIALQYAKENGATSVAIFHHDSPFGLSPVEDGKAWAEANGMSVIAIPMPGGATDFTAQLTQAQDAGVQYIVIQNVSSPSATLVKDVTRLGMDVQVVCLNWCSDELFVRLAGDAAEGVIAASPFAFPSSGADLIENEIRPWTEANGVDLDEKGVHYVQGWTTMRAMVDGIRQVVKDGDEVTGTNIRAALETFTNYSTGGVTTPITFTGSDHAGSKALQLYQVQGGQWVKISDYISASQ